ncbi:MAG: hypothetical protein KAJ75_00095 [Alphaproteobacteria bacterium]|nr:hypothetical protein [Alphaproteobacteria bacterium]
MANYLYKTVLYKTNGGEVLDVPASNATDLSDFETNNKDDVVAVTAVIPAETTFEIWEGYSDFDAYLDDVSFSWTDVKCIETPIYYELYLMSSNAL